MPRRRKKPTDPRRELLDPNSRLSQRLTAGETGLEVLDPRELEDRQSFMREGRRLAGAIERKIRPVPRRADPEKVAMYRAFPAERGVAGGLASLATLGAGAADVLAGAPTKTSDPEFEYYAETGKPVIKFSDGKTPVEALRDYLRSYAEEEKLAIEEARASSEEARDPLSPTSFRDVVQEKAAETVAGLPLQAAPIIGLTVATGGNVPLAFSAERVLRKRGERERDPLELARQGAIGALEGSVVGRLNRIGSVPLRAAGQGLEGAVSTTLEGGRPEDVITSAITNLALEPATAPHGPQPVPTRAEAGVPAEVRAGGLGAIFGRGRKPQHTVEPVPEERAPRGLPPPHEFTVKYKEPVEVGEVAPAPEQLPLFGAARGDLKEATEVNRLRPASPDAETPYFKDRQIIMPTPGSPEARSAEKVIELRTRSQAATLDEARSHLANMERFRRGEDYRKLSGSEKYEFDAELNRLRDETADSPVAGASPKVKSVPERAPKPGDPEDLTGNINTRFRPPSVVERLRQMAAASDEPFRLTWLDRLRTNVWDMLRPAMKAIGELKDAADLDLTPGADPSRLFRLYAGMNAKVNRAFDSGLDSVDGATRYTTSFSELFRPFEDLPMREMEEDLSLVASKIVSERTLELGSRFGRGHRISGISKDPLVPDVDEAQRRLDAIGKESPERLARINEAARAYREYADGLLRYMVDNGRLSAEAYQRIRDSNQFYADFHRLVEDETEFPGREGSKLGSPRSAIREIEGSQKEIENPYVSLMKQTSRVISETDRNSAVASFADIVEAARASDPEMAGAIARRATPGEAGALPVWRRGVREDWVFQKDVLEAMRTITRMEDPTGVLSVLKLPARFMREVVTHTPGFILRNLQRDAVARGVISETGSRPWQTLTDFFKRGHADNLEMMELAGGGQAGHYLSGRVDYLKRLESAMREMSSDGHSILAIPGKAWEFYKGAAARSESVGRLAEYRSAYRKAQARADWSERDRRIFAASEARRLMDFSVGGRVVKAIGEFVPFFNAAVQGPARLAAAARSDPAGVALRWGLYVMLPTALEQAFITSEGERKRREYEQLAAYQKDLFWNIPVGSRWLRIPKPYEIGLPASALTRAYHYATGDKHAFEGLAGNAVKALLPADASTLTGPWRLAVEQLANYDFYRDRPIVPGSDADRYPELRRGTEKASRLGQGISEGLATLTGGRVQPDPRRIDYSIRSLFADFGAAALTASNLGRGHYPATSGDLSERTLGATSGPPAGNARDVEAVFSEAQALGEANAEWVSPIARQLDRIRDSEDPAERARLAEEIRGYATRTRELLPAYREEVLAAVKEAKRVSAELSASQKLTGEERAELERRVIARIRELKGRKMTGEAGRLTPTEHAAAIIQDATASLDEIAAEELLKLVAGRPAEGVKEAQMPTQFSRGKER